MVGIKLDQTMAWIIGVVVSSGVFVAGNMVRNWLISHANDPTKAAKVDHLATESKHQHGHSLSAKAPLPHWGYDGEIGPRNWASLEKGFGACATGRAQSPIDIDTTVLKAGKTKIKFNYRTSVLEFVNNGHTLQANVQDGSYMEQAGKRYDLVQFHFHNPSEHKIDGVAYPMEAHFVHKSPKGELAVVGVMYEESTSNDALAKLWSVLPERNAAKSQVDAFNPYALLPDSKAFFHYSGSLTTPPCAEGVQWLVMRSPGKVSGVQLDMLNRVIRFNARPVQPLFTRNVILQQ